MNRQTTGSVVKGSQKARIERKEIFRKNQNQPNEKLRKNGKYFHVEFDEITNDFLRRLHLFDTAV